MYSPVAFSLSVLAAVCGITAIDKRATPSLYLVGDSTMAFHTASEGIQGCVFDNKFSRKHGNPYTLEVGI
jgi:hypothetical protein